MSVVLRTIRAFPRGTTIEELHALLGTSFRHEERISLLNELAALTKQGSIRRQHDGRWVALPAPVSITAPGSPRSESSTESEPLAAAPFTRSEAAAPPLEDSTDDRDQIEPQALLRYWRSALRADPRGATSEAPDRHGAVWHLISGQGPFAPDPGRMIRLRIALDALAPDFRAALIRRDGNEKTLAIGWPLACGRRAGVPVIWPVGLIAAEWRRADGALEIDVSADDVLLNPEWLKAATRGIGWRRGDLEELFAQTDGIGLESNEFLSRLRDVAAKVTREKITGERLATTLDPTAEGIFDAAGLFLPEDSSFTAGAVRDLDAIATWPEDKLARTALAPLLGLPPPQPATAQPAINVGALNGEQIAAVRAACSAPLTVVTGPPGTGKSQAIVSMAASVLITGGSVLVASKNHQALDAVEERLGNLAPDVPFIVRTLDPSREIDRSFTEILTELAQGDAGRRRPADEVLQHRLAKLADDRANALDIISRRETLECDIAEVLDRLAAHQRIVGDDAPQMASASPAAAGNLIARLVALLRTFFSRKQHGKSAPPAPRSGISGLEADLARLRADRDRLPDPPDAAALTDEIGDLARKILASELMARATITHEDRDILDQARADLAFAGSKAKLPPEVVRMVFAHRPLWLASVLAVPRRLPLDEGIFDLVIFDEASQCDIASALPLLARARRAVVVGDNRQLGFIAQLGQAQDRNLMLAQGLPAARMSRYAQSKQSLFDFSMRIPCAERILLRQQYRSVGPIVDYISREFYGSELKTAYDPRTIRPPDQQKPGMAWTHVPAPVAVEANNVNRGEVTAIVSHVRQLLVEQNYDGTIGVTSPFRGQVHAIEEAVRNVIPMQKLTAAEFRVATVDGFQGQERDVILFSPTLTFGSRTESIGFVQKDFRRLNVAISRARAVAHIFGDLDFARSGKVRSMAALAAAATEPKKRSGDGVFDSEWERIVYHALTGRGLDPKPQYDIAGRRLDFALFGAGGIQLDLEVDGRQFHETADGRRKQSDLWRDHQLKSLGWRVRRFWVDELAHNLEACLDLVERDLS